MKKKVTKWNNERETKTEHTTNLWTRKRKRCFPRQLRELCGILIPVTWNTQCTHWWKTTSVLFNGHQHSGKWIIMGTFVIMCQSGFSFHGIIANSECFAVLFFCPLCFYWIFFYLWLSNISSFWWLECPYKWSHPNLLSQR